MRLLVVEDDLSIQQFLKRALREAGYQVDAAADAKTGEAAALEGVHDASHYRSWSSRSGWAGSDRPLPGAWQFGART